MWSLLLPILRSLHSQPCFYCPSSSPPSSRRQQGDAHHSNPCWTRWDQHSSISLSWFTESMSTFLWELLLVTRPRVQAIQCTENPLWCSATPGRRGNIGGGTKGRSATPGSCEQQCCTIRPPHGPPHAGAVDEEKKAAPQSGSPGQELVHGIWGGARAWHLGCSCACAVCAMWCLRGVIWPHDTACNMHVACIYSPCGVHVLTMWSMFCSF